MTERNEPLGIVLGILLTLGLHLVMAGLILAIAVLAEEFATGYYTSLVVLLIGAAGFFFWQLLYVIPLVIWLQRRRHPGMVKGIVIAACLTALLNGLCFLQMR
ncbi:MAG: hypothetical protein AAFY67_21835 [Cyanobacteria bacterium J06642_9]